MKLAPDRALRAELALEAMRRGEFCVIADGASYAGGELIVAADYVTSDSVNFMVTEGRGIVSVALTSERCRELGLQAMRETHGWTPPKQYMVTIESNDGVSTGISSADRARTISVAADRTYGPADICQPGHVVPVLTRDGGVIDGGGQAEAAVELAQLAGLTPAVGMCHVLDESGDVASWDELEGFCAEHSIPLVAVDDVRSFARSFKRNGTVHGQPVLTRT